MMMIPPFLTAFLTSEALKSLAMISLTLFWDSSGISRTIFIPCDCAVLAAASSSLANARAPVSSMPSISDSLTACHHPVSTSCWGVKPPSGIWWIMSASLPMSIRTFLSLPFLEPWWMDRNLP